MSKMIPNRKTKQLKKKQREERFKKIRTLGLAIFGGTDVTDYSKEKNRSDALYLSKKTSVRNVSTYLLDNLVQARKANETYIQFGKELMSRTRNTQGSFDYLLEEASQLRIFPDFNSSTEFPLGQFFLKADNLLKIEPFILKNESFKKFNFEILDLQYIEDKKFKEGLHVNMYDFDSALKFYMQNRGPDKPNHAILQGEIPNSDAIIQVHFGELMNNEVGNYSKRIYLTDLIKDF